MNKIQKWLAASPFWRDWSNFFRTIINPYVIVLSIIIWFLKDYEINIINDENRFIATIFSSFALTILGGIITHKWIEVSGKSILEARGQGAVRSLNRLIKNLRSLRLRNMTYLKRIQEKLNKEVVKTYIEETIGKCVNLEQSVFHAIDNWTDILPELKKQIKDLEKLKVIDVELNTKEIDLQEKENININLKSKIKKLTGSSNETKIEKERLEKELESERRIAKKLKEEKNQLIEERKQKAKSLLASDLSIGTNLSSSLDLNITGTPINLAGQVPIDSSTIAWDPKRCKICEKPYFDYNLMAVDFGYCEEHRHLGGVSGLVVKDDND